MCLVVLALEQHPRFPLVLLSNRDEFFDRPSAPLDWWTPQHGGPSILGGRDLQAGGTWLGLTAAGRLALVTNVRQGSAPDPRAPSRGQLVPSWLRGDREVDDYWAEVTRAGYNGFNLIAADFARGLCHWASSHAYAAPRRLAPGFYGLSNALLDTPWPKVRHLKDHTRTALTDHAAGESVDRLALRLFDGLIDDRPAPDHELPSTGVSTALERQLSAAFIRTPDGRYGTRCSTLVITERLPHQRVTHVFERSYPIGSNSGCLRRARLDDWPSTTDSAASNRMVEDWPAGLGLRPTQTPALGPRVA